MRRTRTLAGIGIAAAALLALTAWISGKFDSIHFAIDGFWAAFFGAIIISVVSFFISLIVKPGKVARSVAS